MQSYIQTMRSHHEFGVLQFLTNHQYIDHKNWIDSYCSYLQQLSFSFILEHPIVRRPDIQSNFQSKFDLSLMSELIPPD